MAARKNPRMKVEDTTLRHLWLAGLGAAATAQRGFTSAARDAAAQLSALTDQAGTLAGQAQTSVLGGIASVCEQGEARATRFSADVEARLAPVLAKLGLKQPRASRTRTPVSKKVAGKRASAPATRKSTARRKAAATRA